MSNKAVMYDGNLYTPNNGDTVIYDSVTDKFVPTAPSFGPGGLTSTTYSALAALALSSNLVPGAYYEITDYQTSHYIQYSGPVTGSGGIGGEEVNLGPVEPLIVQALSYSELSINASSSAYPNDKILYLISVPDGDYDYASSTGKGCIIYREDTVKKITRDYDWRNVVFRRWETSPGSGDFFSVLPVIGSAYQDVSPFSDPDTCYDVYIKSPLDNPLGIILITGSPYWLDNTVFEADVVTDTSSNFAFGNHITGYNGDKTTVIANQFNIMVNNLISTEQFVGNQILSLNSNTLIQSYTLTYSDIFGFSFNKVSDFNSNTYTGFVYSNTVISVLGNTGIDQIGCTCLSINANTCDIISVNTGEIISDNIANEISGNNVVIIGNNDCKDIKLNVGVQCIYNTTSGDINYNNVLVIDSNTCTYITNNAGVTISNNTIGAHSITYNNSTYIVGNSNTGDIYRNTTAYIYDNTNSGNIIYNNCTAIYGNSNGNYISTNTGQVIYDNTNSGYITNNTVTSIESNNSNVNRISGNIGYQVSNNTINGDIIGNSVHNIFLNSGTGDIGQNKGYSLSTNTFDGNFGKNTFRVFDSNTFGNSAGSNIISEHNFIDSVASFTVYPTAAMSSATPTKTMYDVGNGQHSEVTLTAGVVSYLTVTT